VCEDKSKEHKVAVAMLYRYEADNGILFQIKLENETKFYLLIRLVIDEDNHMILAHKGKKNFYRIKKLIINNTLVLIIQHISEINIFFR